MDDAHPSELAGAASSSRGREAECAARRVGRASFYKFTAKEVDIGFREQTTYSQYSLVRGGTRFQKIFRL